MVVLHAGPVTRDQMQWVAVLHAGPASQLAGLTALERCGLRRWLRDDLHVVVPFGVRVPPLTGLAIHTTRLELLIETPDGPRRVDMVVDLLTAVAWSSRSTDRTTVTRLCALPTL